MNHHHHHHRTLELRILFRVVVVVVVVVVLSSVHQPQWIILMMMMMMMILSRRMKKNVNYTVTMIRIIRTFTFIATTMIILRVVVVVIATTPKRPVPPRSYRVILIGHHMHWNTCRVRISKRGDRPPTVVVVVIVIKMTTPPPPRVMYWSNGHWWSYDCVPPRYVVPTMSKVAIRIMESMYYRPRIIYKLYIPTTSIKHRWKSTVPSVPRVWRTWPILPLPLPLPVRRWPPTVVTIITIVGGGISPIPMIISMMMPTGVHRTENTNRGIWMIPTNVCIRMYVTTIWINVKSTLKTTMTMSVVLVPVQLPRVPRPPPWRIRPLDNVLRFVGMGAIVIPIIRIIITTPPPIVPPMVGHYTSDCMPIPIVPFMSNRPVRPIPLRFIHRDCRVCRAIIMIPPNRRTPWSPIPPLSSRRPPIPMIHHHHHPHYRRIIHCVRIYTIPPHIAIRNSHRLRVTTIIIVPWHCPITPRGKTMWSVPTLHHWKTTCTMPTGMSFYWNRVCTDCSVPFGGRGMVWKMNHNPRRPMLRNIVRSNWGFYSYPCVSFVPWVSRPIPCVKNYCHGNLYRGRLRLPHSHPPRYTTRSWRIATSRHCSRGMVVAPGRPWPSIVPIRGLRWLVPVVVLVMKHRSIHWAVMTVTISSSPRRRKRSDPCINPMVVPSHHDRQVRECHVRVPRRRPPIPWRYHLNYDHRYQQHPRSYDFKIRMIP